ncbi:MAG: aminodeoxychorismate synthase component I, partial [Pseudomonadales bacterium]|nr:aminodeoxychorismate synthase component I [Pseudomonadales bacterium]
SVVGSVSVDPLFALQSFAQVHHMVSDIHATLSPSFTYLDALLGCFPGGSITGAPKHRAMQIIEELESVPRSAYCGSIFCLGKDFLESNIAIRTLVADAQGSLHAWAGGGITADSTMQDEYEECNHKMGALLRTLAQEFSAR